MSSTSDRERLAAEYALLSQLLNDRQRQIELLNAAISEVTTTRSVLEELEKMPKGTELLVPVGSGVYIRVSYTGSEKALVNVGSSVIVEKSISDAISFLAERERKLREQLSNLVSEYQRIAAKISELEKALSPR